MDITLDVSKPVLLVDGSYFIFYRFFAVLNWWNRQEENNGKTATDAMNDVLFKDKYKKLFENNLRNLAKVYEVPWSNIVFVKDCPRDQIWRNALYPSYKATRDNARSAKSFDSRVFTITINNILPSLGCQVMDSDKLEADDVIGIIVRHIYSKYKDVDMTVITNDNDYVQLCSLSTNLSIVNLNGLQIKERIEIDDVNLYLLYKSILGDKSDNIPPIAAKCGIKTALKLAKNPDELNKLFDKNPAAKTQFLLNKLLMDFEQIPEHYVHQVTKRVKIKN